MLMDKERLPSLSSFSRVSVALAHMSQLPLDASIFPWMPILDASELPFLPLDAAIYPWMAAFVGLHRPGVYWRGKESNTKVDSEGNFHLE